VDKKEKENKWKCERKPRKVIKSQDATSAAAEEKRMWNYCIIKAIKPA
jgi:hypothetical protein